MSNPGATRKKFRAVRRYRRREHAEVRELIDASPYAKKYTSGVLSFEESDLAPGQREKLMESFERVLMPGLDKDQYSVLWVEHSDKGRVELNFLIPNTELLTGKRLQPYYDRADRPRVDAWQTVVNGRMGFSDPNDPLKRRALVTARTLPETKQEAVRAITNGLLTLASSGELKTRQDVTEALTASGFEVVRTTKSSISIADPDGGQGISEMKRTEAMLSKKNNGVRLSVCGEIANDRTGNTVIERIRATAAGLRAAAERVGSRLLGVAEDVWHYATGERETERAGEQLKQAGAEFERAAAPLVREMNGIEQRRELENLQRQEQQHEKALLLEWQQRQKGHGMER